MTLREELGATPDPEFQLELPKGWGRHGIDDASLQAMLAKVKRRCMDNHQPQLYIEMKTHLEQAFADMRRAEVVAFFCPTDPGPETVAIPSSINASIRKAESGQTLDDIARGLIRDHDAKPLFGDPRTLRFESEKSIRIGTATVINHSAVYLTPIPGTMRRRALALVAAFARTPDVSADSVSMNATRSLFDACVSTLRWTHPEGA